MAKRENQEQTIFKTEEERIAFEQKYKKELSVGTYAKNQIFDIVVNLGSIAGGGVAGWMLAGKKDSKIAKNAVQFYKKVQNRLYNTGAEEPKSTDEKGNNNDTKVFFAVVGAFIGAIVSGVILGYRGWKKQESERLAVQEINEDVSEMKIRNRTNPELVKENTRLREMLEKEANKTEGLKTGKSKKTQEIIEKGERTPIEHSAASNQQVVNAL